MTPEEFMKKNQNGYFYCTYFKAQIRREVCLKRHGIEKKDGRIIHPMESHESTNLAYDYCRDHCTQWKDVKRDEKRLGKRKLITGEREIAPMRENKIAEEKPQVEHIPQQQSAPSNKPEASEVKASLPKTPLDPQVFARLFSAISGQKLEDFVNARMLFVPLNPFIPDTDGFRKRLTACANVNRTTGPLQALQFIESGLEAWEKEHVKQTGNQKSA